MENKIRKAIFGLIATVILVTAMVPAGFAGFDEHGATTDADGDGYVELPTSAYTISDTNTGDNAKITVNLDVDGSPAEYAAVTLVHGTNAQTNYGMIPERDGVNSYAFSFDTNTILGTDDTEGNKFVDLYIEIDNDGDGTYDEYYEAEDVTITVSKATPDNTIPQSIFDIDKIEDQTGDDEINPGDEVIVKIDMDADDDNMDIIYEDMILKGTLYDSVTGERYADDETGYFTLGDETESTKYLHFQLPTRIRNIDDETMSDRLYLVFEAYADLRSDDGKTYGNSVWTGNINEKSAENYWEDLAIDLDASENDLTIYDPRAPTSITAGDSIPISFELRNTGVDDQNKIDVNVEVDGLNVKFNQMIETLVVDDATIVNAGLAIPNSARAGTYNLIITATSDEGASASYTKTITVEGTSTPRESDLTVDKDEVALTNGKAKFTFEIENLGNERKVYDLSVEGVDADVQSKITVEAGATKEFKVTAKEAGEFTVFARSGDEEVSADAEATAASTGIAKEQVIQVLQWVFAVIIIIAIILVIIWAVTKGRKGNDKEVYY